MKSNGLLTLTFDDNTVRNIICTGEIVEDLEGATATLTAQVPFTEPWSWTPENPFVRMVDNNGEELFSGWVRDWDESDDLSMITYNIWADDPRLNYKTSIPIDTYRFPKGTTVNTALSTLINNYTTDTLGLSDISDEDLFESRIANTNLSDAIHTILGTLKYQIVWYTDYDPITGKIIHSFKEAFAVKQGTISNGEGVIITSGKFKWNRQDVRNYVRVQARQVPSANPFLQRVYFRRTEFDAGRKGKQEYRIPLAMRPDACKVYLMVGEWTSDPVNISRCTYYDLKIEGLTDKDKGAVINDLEDLFDNKSRYYRAQSIQIAGASAIGPEELVELVPDSNLLGQVRRIISGLCHKDLTCYLSTSPASDNPETANGYILVPSLPYLKEKITWLRTETNLDVDADHLLGYAISFNVTRDVNRVFTDADSIAARGKKISDTYQLNTTDLSTLNIYGMGKLAYLKDPIKEGTIDAVAWREGVRYLQFYPKPGKLIDFVHPVRGTEVDLAIRSRTIRITQTDMTVSVSSKFESPRSSLLQMLTAIETTANLNSSLGNDSVMESSHEDKIGLTDSVTTVVTDREDNNKWNGQPIHRLWLN